LILGIFQSPLSVRQQLFEPTYIRFVHGGGGAQMALPLGAFLGQDVTLVGLAPFDAAGCGHPEALGRPAVGFQLGHFSLLYLDDYKNPAGNALPAGVTFLCASQGCIFSGPDTGSLINR
jgi:hypothetical protein